MGAPLDDEPFAYRVTKDGQVRVSFRGRVVSVATGPRAARLRRELRDADAAAAQLALAKVTGQFKFGNEREGKDRGRRC